MFLGGDQKNLTYLSDEPNVDVMVINIDGAKRTWTTVVNFHLS